MSAVSQQTETSNVIHFPNQDQNEDSSVLNTLIDEIRQLVADARKPISYTESQAAEYLGIEVLTLKRIRREGKISYSRIGRVFHYTEEHLRNFIVASQQLCAADRKGR